MIARVHLEDVWRTDCRGPCVHPKLDKGSFDLDENHVTFRADKFVIELSYNTDEEVKWDLLDFLKGRHVGIHAVSIRDPESGTYYNTIVSGVLIGFDFPEDPPREEGVRVEMSVYGGTG
jgi:hypothetical protein